MRRVEVLLPLPLEQDYGAYLLAPENSGLNPETQLFTGEVVGVNQDGTINVQLYAAHPRWEPVKNVARGNGIRQYRVRRADNRARDIINNLGQNPTRPQLADAIRALARAITDDDDPLFPSGGGRRGGGGGEIDGGV